MNLFKQTKQDRDYLALQELLKPVEEQDEATGILSKPKKPEDEESMVTGFFSSMFDRSKQRSAELAQEMQEQQRISEEQEISDYLRRTTVSDALYDELKLPNPAYGGLKLVEDRPMTEAELEQYAPLLDLANDIMEETITVKELGAMNRMDQEAFLKSLSDLKVNERSSSFEGDTFEVASSREDFLRDLMKKREADTAKPKDDEASRLKEFLLREETDITSDDVKPVDADTIDADGGAAPSGKGLMSPRLDKKGETSFYNPDVVTKEGKAGLKEAQKVLKGLGYYGAKIDGETGPNTSNAIKVYQYDNDLEVTGELDSATKKKLAEGGTSVPKPENELLASISEHEGSYGAANNGTSSLVKKKFSVPGTYYSDTYNKPLTEMTVNEILNAQNGTTGKTDAELLLLDPETETAIKNRDLFAVGAYQIIPTTMQAALAAGSVSGDETFSPELQDRVALQFLAGSDRPKLRDYIRGVEGASLEDAAMDLAKQWASFPVPKDVYNKKGKLIAKKGSTRYGSGNRALHDLTSTKNMLKSVREAFIQQVQTAVP